MFPIMHFIFVFEMKTKLKEYLICFFFTVLDFKAKVSIKMSILVRFNFLFNCFCCRIPMTYRTVS